MTHPKSDTTKTRLSAAFAAVSLSVALSTLLVTGCNTSKVVATVNGQSITESEFNDKYKQFFQMNTGMENPNDLQDDAAKPLLMGIKKETLDFLIQDRLVKAEFEKQKLSVTDADVEARYQSILKDVGVPEADFLVKLAKHGLNKDTFKQTLKDQLITEVVVTKIDKTVDDIPDADIQRFFETHRQQYDMPPMREARHILIAADMKDPKAKASAKGKAEEVLAMLKAKPNRFEELAKSRSADKGSADNGGNLGYFSADMMVPTFSKAVFNSPVGKLVPTVVESPYGFHVIEVLGAKPAKPASFAAKKNEIRTKLREQRLSVVLNTWLTNQKESQKITYAEGFDFSAEMRKQQEALTKQIEQAAQESATKAEKVAPAAKKSPYPAQKIQTH